MRRRTAAAVALLVSAALCLSACAAPASTASEVGSNVVQVPLDQLTPLSDPKAYEGPSTALMADVVITPIAENPAQQLPVTVVSHDLTGDTEVTVADTSRVIAMDLSGSLAATVWGMGFGDSLIGRDISTTFPGAADLPVVTTGGHTLNAESIIALKPTLVLTDGSIGPNDVVAQLRDVGITVVFVEDAASFTGAADLARAVGEVFGAPEPGELLAQRITDEVAAVREQIAALAPTDPADRLRIVFLYVRGGSGVYYLFGGESGADQIIEGLSAVDVAGELGWSGMQPLTDEAMVAADPDLILLMTNGLESTGGIDGLLETKPAVALTQAGQHRRFVDMADGQILSFGPRSAQVLEALARAIYAPDAS